MKLIGSLTSPFVRKVRIAMLEKQIEHEMVLEDVWASDAIQAANPLGKVPCLLLPDGQAVFDSRVIVEHLDGTSPMRRLIPDAGRDRTEVLTFEAAADGILDASILARLEATWNGRTDRERSQAWIDRQLGKIDASLGFLSQRLADKPWCIGADLTLADISVGCALDYLSFRFPQIDWRGRHANLVRLVDRLGERPSFVETRPPVPA